MDLSCDAVPRAAHRKMSRILSLALGAGLLLAGGAATAAPAQAFSLTDFKAGVLTNADDETAYFQTAGGRPPFGVTDFSFATDSNGEPVGNAKSIRIDIPPGLAPNFAAFPTCTDEQLADRACPVGSQIGVQRITVRGTIPTLPTLTLGTFGARQTILVRIPVYNMTRSADQVARFAVNPMQAPGSDLLSGDRSPILINGGVRDSDTGLYFTIPKLPTDPAISDVRLVFWGVPGATSHDAERGQSTTHIPEVEEHPIFGPALRLILADQGGNQAPPSELRNVAFLTNPTTCAGVQTSSITAESTAGEIRKADYTTPVGVEGCGAVPFSPSVSYTSPGAITRDSPTPFKVHLKVPQTQDASRLGTAHVKTISATMPTGVTINPSAATGLETCTDAQFGKGTSNAGACPAASKVGTTKITSPLLEGSLTGSAYVGQSLPGAKYRLFVDAYGFGIKIRLTGVVGPDPRTGQITATFNDNPQLPFSDFELDFAGGPRAILASPQTCGGYVGNTAFGPWSGTPTVDSRSVIEVGGCTDGFPFNPGFAASAGSSQAGAYTPFAMRVARSDGNQYLSGLRVTLPRGQIARLRGKTQCTSAQIAAIACPADSQIGFVSTKAGPGPEPFSLRGNLYFTGAYGGGQFGAVAVIRAVAGPYDLGYVVVRQAINIDPSDAHVTITSDPLPQILEGIPLRLRELAIDISKPEFMRNPTSCAAGTVTAGLTSLNGASAGPTSSVPSSGCANQRFRPKLTLELRNKTQMGKNKHPQVRATLNQEDEEAGIKSAQVTLPKSLALAAANAKGLCEVAQAAADNCPKASIVGSASATSPILNRTLKGAVYFVKGERTDPKTGRVIRTLPTLMVPLRGEVTIILRGDTAVSKNRLVTTFGSLPDAPITRFTLTISGGKHGIIATTRDICKTSKSSLKATVALAGHHGKSAKTQKPTLGTTCKSAKKKSAKKAEKSTGRKKKSTRK